MSNYIASGSTHAGLSRSARISDCQRASERGEVSLKYVLDTSPAPYVPLAIGTDQMPFSYSSDHLSTNRIQCSSIPQRRYPRTSRL